jgi:predicted nuclease of restriction endonuclease-like (RecB) superfamily
VNPIEHDALLAEVRHLLQAARHAAARQVNALLVHTNYEIGRRIVEHEQGGSVRAEYGRELVRTLAQHLTEEFGRGYSADNLWAMRRFFLAFPARSRIAETPSQQLLPTTAEIVETVSTRFEVPSRPFTLSWSHYVFLTAITDPTERSFYEVEATQAGWSLRELRRQFDTSLFERLALSRDQDGVRALAAQGQVIEKPTDLLKDPYVLDFLGLEAQPTYSEADLESGIIDKLEHFLMELGKGFLFEGRQRRFTFDDDHFYVDLVFYNRLLRCFVLVDLKIGKLTHQDLGQMQMYVHYYDRYVKLPQEAPTIGIILCKKKHDALVEITLPEGANIHAQEYRLALPSKEELRQKLLEWAGEEG